MADQASVNKTREVLERVSRVVELHPDLTAREVRARSGLARKPTEEALELLRRAGFINRQARTTEDTYRSALPYRAKDHAPRAGYGSTYSTGQGGGG
jgi:hypothetical protein